MHESEFLVCNHVVLLALCLLDEMFTHTNGAMFICGVGVCDIEQKIYPVFSGI